MPKLFLPTLVAALVLAGVAALPAVADQAHKKPHKAVTAPAAGSSAPSRASDLNSPATDFSGVAPVIDDPQAERLKPHKKKDPNFD